MARWFRRRTREIERPTYRTEYLTVRDVANHSGTGGYVRIDQSDTGGLIGFTVSKTTPSYIGRSPEGQPWITGGGTVSLTADSGMPWAYVQHTAGEGMTVYLPDEWGDYIVLLADNPNPDKWLPAAPGKPPEDTQPRGIRAGE